MNLTLGSYRNLKIKSLPHYGEVSSRLPKSHYQSFQNSPLKLNTADLTAFTSSPYLRSEGCSLTPFLAKDFNSCALFSSMIHRRHTNIPKPVDLGVIFNQTIFHPPPSPPSFDSERLTNSEGSVNHSVTDLPEAEATQAV